jgi:hypothetical protein
VIDLEAARALLDFGKRIGDGPRAEEQLRGAVAIHNLLRTHGVAYCQEVGVVTAQRVAKLIAVIHRAGPSALACRA